MVKDFEVIVQCGRIGEFMVVWWFQNKFTLIEKGEC